VKVKALEGYQALYGLVEKMTEFRTLGRNRPLLFKTFEHCC